MSVQAISQPRRISPRAAVGPLAHPMRPVTPAAVRRVSSCGGIAVARPGSSDVWLRVKVALVAVLALGGSAAAVAGFTSWSHPDPTVEYVQGDPAWAHVEAWR